MGSIIDIRKLQGRSWDELRYRGGQAVSAYSEKIGLSNRQISDAELFKLVDKRWLGLRTPNMENLSRAFFENARRKFFRSCHETSAADISAAIGQSSVDRIITSANNILAGRFNLLGYRNLYVGTQIDWHLEPISGMRSPTRHWKEFDELDSSETGDKKVIWELNRHQHLFDLGAAYKITGDQVYAATIVEHLTSWIEQNPAGIGINWVSSLEVSFRVMSWIWALNLVADSPHLTQDVLKNVFRSLYQHGWHIEKYLSRFYSPNTHLTGEALGLFYLGTQLPFFERSRHWRALGADILFDEATRQIRPDGVYFEQSTWYQRYTVDFYQQFFLLRDLQDQIKPDHREKEAGQRVRSAVEFMADITRPDGTTPLIGDDDGGTTLPRRSGRSDDMRASIAAAAGSYNDPTLKFIGGDATECLFWLYGHDAVEKYRKMPSEEPSHLSKIYPDGGYMLMRDGWEPTDNFMVVDFGDLGGLASGHGHADTLSFDVSIGGRTTLVDPGTYTYHESREMRDLFRSSQMHNTISMNETSSSDPGGIFSWRSKAAGKLIAYTTDDRFDHLRAEHDGFESTVPGAKHERSILFLHNDYWIVHDLAGSPGLNEYSAAFHYAPSLDPRNSDDGRFVGDESHRIFAFGDGGKWLRNESWVSLNYGSKVNSALLRFSLEGTGLQEFVTFIMPCVSGYAAPEIVEEPLDGGRAFMISHRGMTDVLIVGDGETHLKTRILNTNFALTWARIMPGETSPYEVIAINGKELSIGSNHINRSDESLGFVRATCVGGDFYVNTDLGRSIVSVKD